jgi:hypothetical protein
VNHGQTPPGTNGPGGVYSTTSLAHRAKRRKGGRLRRGHLFREQRDLHEIVVLEVLARCLSDRCRIQLVVILRCRRGRAASERSSVILASRPISCGLSSSCPRARELRLRRPARTRRSCFTRRSIRRERSARGPTCTGVSPAIRAAPARTTWRRNSSGTVSMRSRREITAPPCGTMSGMPRIAPPSIVR